MAIRIACPSCEASLTFDDEKSGKKVRCRKCDDLFTIPAASGSKRKRDDDEAVQDGRKLKVKARSRAEDDDDDDRPAKKKKSKADKKGSPVLLLAIGGGVAAFILFLIVGGVGAYFLFRSSPAAPEMRAAQADGIQKFNADPNPMVNPNPNVNPNPIVNPANQKPVPNFVPIPIIDPNAGKPLPDRMAGDTIQRVKQATVYVRVTSAAGEKSSGSGFLAIEPGLVITNAHVVGMLQANGQPPRQVEIFVNSGQPNELKVDGQLLGVDRTSDLAVVRINVNNLPPPLPLDTTGKLVELQKVYIFGFPLGEAIGKEITVSESSIASLRAKEIQVNGGMTNGNSGGPVVNANGSVIGVAVSGFKGTQVNFAIPAEKVQRAMEGRVSDVTLGDAFLANGQTRLPVKVACLDPLKRIQQVRVEVWTGAPGQPRPFSVQPPQPAPGDGPRQAHTITYQNGVGSFDVPLPALAPGQVYWLQPVTTSTNGMQWATAVTASSVYPLERQPANLVSNLSNVKNRTVKLKSSDQVSVVIGNEKKGFSETVEADILEVVAPDPKGFRIRTGYGPNLSITRVSDLKQLPATKPIIVDGLRALAPIFTVDPNSKVLNHKGSGRLPPMTTEDREDVMDNYARVCNSLEAVMVPMPNRMVQPLENWQASVPLPLRVSTATPAGPGPKKKGPTFGPPSKFGPGPTMRWDTFDLVLTCTYEGTRTRDNRREALVSVVGKVQGRGINANTTRGNAAGKIALDLDGNFISFSQLKISQQVTLKGESGDLALTTSMDIDLTRSAGNLQNIQLPPEVVTPVPGPGPVPTPMNPNGKIILTQKGVIFGTDPVDQALAAQTKKKNYTKFYDVPLKANTTYTISLNSNTFDSYLRLVGQTAGPVAQDDNSGGGKNARITYRPMRAETYRIFVISHDGRTGPFDLSVVEAP